jgi:hypothetical protein
MHAARRYKRLLQRCSRTVDALHLPSPFDAARFIDGLAAARGRNVVLLPVTARPHIPCGLLITTDRTHCILYAADTTPLHQQHILLHEAAHLICGHHETSPAPAAAAQVLLPHLPASLVQRVLGRSVYTEPQEAEAELVASLILNRVSRLDRAKPAPLPAGRGEARLRSLFGAPPPEARRAPEPRRTPEPRA